VLDQAIHAYLRALVGARAVRIDPFLVTLDDHDAGLFRNYAIPDDGAKPTGAQVTKLVAAFTGHDRTPRLEYLPGLCPAVEPGLLAAGFLAERQLPVMSCAPDAVIARAAPEGIRLCLASSDIELRQVAEVQTEAYGQHETTDHDVVRLRGTVERGGLVALALDTSTGQPVGGGLCAPPHCGVTELAAIGVRALYRGRGIAAGLTAFLTGACASVNITTSFLTPIGEAEERIYRSVGYRPVTQMLHISRSQAPAHSHRQA